MKQARRRRCYRIVGHFTVLTNGSTSERPSAGEVFAIGEGSALAEKLVVGERVLFQKFSGAEVKLDDGLYVILADTDILGRIIEAEPVKRRSA